MYCSLDATVVIHQRLCSADFIRHVVSPSLFLMPVNWTISIFRQAATMTYSYLSKFALRLWGANSLRDISYSCEVETGRLVSCFLTTKTGNQGQYDDNLLDHVCRSLWTAYSAEAKFNKAVRLASSTIYVSDRIIWSSQAIFQMIQTFP